MRTIFIIPIMFSREELAKINPNLPQDYKERSEEFWNYVAEKLRTQRTVQKLYYDSLTRDNIQEALEFIGQRNKQSLTLVEGFKKLGAELRETEDPILLQETASWAGMRGDEMKQIGVSDSNVTHELFVQSMIDRDKHVAKTIGESLSEGETGVLFLSPGRHASEFIPSDIRVIKVQPFDPSDYVNSWLVSSRLRSNQRSSKISENQPSSD